ncbi:hypothetical protein LIER_05663 [Lithospermum erythrorhizon]|uniref:Uncharacterized protein n=1 Tax=Lithospermum erythrorhizon TaxID=34254 RepID=A0AAV3P1I4_LITER
MAHTKRTTAMRPSSSLKRSKSAGGVKFSSPSFLCSERPVIALISPMPSPDRATHDSLLPLLDQVVASASRALVDGHSTLYQQILELGEELSQEFLKDTKRAKEERDATYQVPIGVIVLSYFVLNFQAHVPILPALAAEYRQWFPIGWLDNT